MCKNKHAFSPVVKSGDQSVVVTMNIDYGPATLPPHDRNHASHLPANASLLEEPLNRMPACRLQYYEWGWPHPDVE